MLCAVVEVDFEQALGVVVFVGGAVSVLFFMFDAVLRCAIVSMGVGL